MNSTLADLNWKISDPAQIRVPGAGGIKRIAKVLCQPLAAAVLPVPSACLILPCPQCQSAPLQAGAQHGAQPKLCTRTFFSLTAGSMVI